jgi:hypothetical protein
MTLAVQGHYKSPQRRGWGALIVKGNSSSSIPCPCFLPFRPSCFRSYRKTAKQGCTYPGTGKLGVLAAEQTKIGEPAIRKGRPKEAMLGQKPCLCGRGWERKRRGECNDKDARAMLRDARGARGSGGRGIQRVPSIFQRTQQEDTQKTPKWSG